MSVNNFIPEIWSARVLERLHKTHVFGDVANRDYEGEIRNAGDTVHINSVGPVTVAAYTKNSTSITPEVLTDSDMLLQISQAYYFAFYVDDVDKRQAQADILAAGMDEAAYNLADTADQYIAGLWENAGSISGATAVTSINAYAGLLSLAEALDEANVPADGRWCVIPPWYKTKLLLAEVLLPSVDGTDAWANGRIGRCAGFDLRVSNNVDTDSTESCVMAGSPRAISYAEQINSIEAYRPEAKFADAIKGLHLYGAKVVQPAALAVLKATETAEA